MCEKYRFDSGLYRIDRKLYKYYSNFSFALDCINQNRIHLAPAVSFNDPFDAAVNTFTYSDLNIMCSWQTFVNTVLDYLLKIPEEQRKESYIEMLHCVMNTKVLPSVEDKYRLAKDRLEQLYGFFLNPTFSCEEFIEAVDEGFRTGGGKVVQILCKASCFSELWNSVSMWSYYGAEHQGICIEFDLQLLDKTDELNREILEALAPVHYSPIRAGVPYFSNPPSLNNFFFTKTDEWSHEHEWRIVCETEEEFLPFPCISNIYIGAKFDIYSSAFETLKEAVSKHEFLDIQQCQLCTDTYNLTSKTVYDSVMGKALTQLVKTSANPGVGGVATKTKE